MKVKRGYANRGYGNLNDLIEPLYPTYSIIEMLLACLGVRGWPIFFSSIFTAETEYA